MEFKPLSERWCKPVLNRYGKKIYLDQMTVEELKERVEENDIVIVPVGSMENHGPPSPIGEDTFIGVSIAERAAYETGVTVAPPIFYGSHPSHHYGMPGTIPVSKDAFIGYLVSVVKWLSHAGFKKIILWNSHGQEYVLPIVKDKAIVEEGVHALIMVTSWWSWVQDLLRKAGTGEEIAPGVRLETPFIHADEVETSCIWYVAPELVDVEAMKRSKTEKMTRFIDARWINAAGNVFPDKPFNWYDVSNPPEIYHYSLGVVGDASKADIEKGRVLIEKSIERFIEFLEWLKSEYPPGRVPKTWIDPKDLNYDKP